MQVRVEVTAEDIRQGERGTCHACPVALALGRAAGGEWVVDYVTVHKVAHGLTAVYRRLPRPARKWVWQFDNREPVEPFAFTLDLPA